MKFIVRSFLTVGAALFITSWVVPGFYVDRDIISFLLVTAAMVMANWFAKALFKIIFLPLNLATFGFFTLIINAIILYGIQYFFSGISVSSWVFPGYIFNGFVLPQMTFGIIATYIVAGLIISVVSTIVDWLIKV